MGKAKRLRGFRRTALIIQPALKERGIDLPVKSIARTLRRNRNFNA